MTEQQLRALDFIRSQRSRAGFSPTIAEIATHLGIADSRAGDIVNALVRMGKLVKVRGHSRNLDLANVPDVRLVDSRDMWAELARRGETTDALKSERRRAFARGDVTCAADTCGIVVKRGHLFCRDHWFELPANLRNGILAAFRAKDTERYQELVTQARDLVDMGIAA